MEKLPERKRKSKGRLSVLDEFTGEAGVIDFKPTISLEEQERIDLKTKLADAPISTLFNPSTNNESVFNAPFVANQANKVEPKCSQSAAKVSTQPEPQPEPRPSYSSSTNFLNEKTTTIALPDNLARFGISIINLQNLITSGKTTFEVIDRSLAALSFDVENGKTGNLANILFGVLGSGREYISQKHSENLQTELDQELARIAEAEENQKRVLELKLQAKFQEHIQSNPELIDSIREKNKGYISDQGLLEKMAFEEFKENLSAEAGNV